MGGQRAFGMIPVTERLRPNGRCVSGPISG